MPKVIEAAAPPQSAAASIAAQGPAVGTTGCADHSSSQHIRVQTKDLTRHSSRLIVEQRGVSTPPE